MSIVAFVLLPAFSLDVAPDGLSDPAEHSQAGLGVRERSVFQFAHRSLAASAVRSARVCASSAQSELHQRVLAGHRGAVPGVGPFSPVSVTARFFCRDFTKLPNDALMKYAGAQSVEWERWLRQQAEKMVRRAVRVIASCIGSRPRALRTISRRSSVGV